MRRCREGHVSDIQRKVDQILADIPAFRAELYAAVRKEHPDITQEALDAAWEQAAQLFGLYDVDD